MNFAELILKATKEQASKQISNNIGDIYVGTMSGTDSVTMEDGYTIGGEMLLFTQFCYDQVIEIPYKDSTSSSHHHQINEAIDHVVVASPVGLCSLFTDAVGIANVQSVQARIDAGDPTALAEMAAICQAGSADTTKLSHNHTEEDALPKIRLWRGVKDGDKVLVMKVNTRHFIVLCRLEGVTNEEDEECKGHVDINA